MLSPQPTAHSPQLARLAKYFANYFDKNASFLCVFLLLSSQIAHASDNPGVEIQRRQAIQLEQSQSKQREQIDSLSASPAPSDPEQVLVSEATCFNITQFVLTEAGEFAWLSSKAERFVNQCMGPQTLKRLRDYLTLALIERGYITSRIVYPEQNLKQGILAIQLIPGRVGNVISQGDAAGLIELPLTLRSGGLLNQRDLDQSLENFCRLPSQAETSFELVPGAELGYSDLLITHAQASRWQGGIGLDDAGGNSTGKHQLSLNLSIDSPLRLYDSLRLTLNGNANYQNSAFGNQAAGLQWSVPLGNISAFIGINQSDYKQTVAGYVAPIAYTGNSRMLEAGENITWYPS